MTPLLEGELRLPMGGATLRAELALSAQVTGIFGPSGAGKTSLLEAIVGLRRDARGVLRFRGRTWLDSAARRRVSPDARGVGYVPQGGLLFPHLDVRQNLAVGRARAERAGQDFARTLDTVIDTLALRDHLGEPVARLSGGERQRVALGRALCSGPELLVLDEPMASLDLPLRRRLLPFLSRVREQFDVPLILVSHDPLEIQALCDDVVALSGGAVIGQGAPSELLSDPSVFSLAEGGMRNVWRAEQTGTTPTGTRARLGGGQVEITVRGHHGVDGSPMLVALAADRIMLARKPPEGLSAANVLPVRIERVRQSGPLSLVDAHLTEGLPPLWIELAGASLARLGLGPGSQAHAVFKASSCEVWESAQTTSHG